ncbi:hypothetical protein CsSME_00009648 [Camellia sinensis var. sinensis]
MPSSVISLQLRRLRDVRLRQWSEIRDRASSPMLTLWSHFRVRVVMAVKRESKDGTEKHKSATAMRERRCRDCPSTSNQRRQTKEQQFLSPPRRKVKMEDKHSSGRFLVWSRPASKHEGGEST